MTVLPTTRLRSIDALRGIAALGVVFYHAVDQSAKVVPANLLKYPVKLTQFVASFGYIGVFLFFVISGFCIHLQWAKSRTHDPDPKLAFGAFWKRRIWRLYPPYLIAICIFLVWTATTVGVTVNRFFIYDITTHLLMLHNLDPWTCYSINGVFWTLAIEEQLYLAYFLLLFLRKRWGWTITLTICLIARAGWMTFSHLVWLKTGIGVPVPEAALCHWFTWALGALAVEAWFGLVKLPSWTRDLRLAAGFIVLGGTIAYFHSSIPNDTFWHNSSWFLMHPLWGLGFFMVVNRGVLAEKSWLRQLRLPSLVSIFATLGVFSYSIYLTHELAIMQSWRWTDPGALQIQNVILVVIPTTLVVAWLYFWFCERPFMTRKSSTSSSDAPKRNVLEPQPSAAGD